VFPMLRHPDADLHLREHGDRLGVGAYGHRRCPPTPRVSTGRAPTAATCPACAPSPTSTSSPAGTPPRPCCPRSPTPRSSAG
jgi:hypothetical protein